MRRVTPTRRAAALLLLVGYAAVVIVGVLISDAAALRAFIVVSCAGGLLARGAEWLMRYEAAEHDRPWTWWLTAGLTAALTGAGAAATGAPLLAIVAIALAAGTFFAATAEPTLLRTTA